MTAQAIRAGEAFVELTLRDSATKELGRFGDQLGALGKRLSLLGLATGGFAAAIQGPLAKSVTTASNAEEAYNKFRAVFGDLADAAENYAARSAAAVNRSAADIRNQLATFQSFFVGLGFEKTGAAELSQQLSALAIDFASFNNLSDEEALERFISALSGSSEVLDRFGINIKAAAINEELLRQGINKTTANATEQEKTLARLAIIAKSLGQQGAIGDAAKTADSYANRLKGLSAAFQELKIAIGQPLLAARAEFVATLTEITQSLTAFVDSNTQIVQLAAVTGTALTVLAAGLTTVGTAALTASFFLNTFSGLGRAVAAPVTIAGTAAATAAKGMFSLAYSAGAAAVNALRNLAAAALSAGIYIASTLYRAVLGLAGALTATLTPAVLHATGAILYFAGAAVVTTVYVAAEAMVAAASAIAAAFGVVIPAAIGESVAAFYGFLLGPALVPAAIVGAIGALFLFDTVAANTAAAVASLGKGFRNLASIATTGAQGIYYAFLNSDYPGLFKILGVTLQAAWFQTLATLVDSTRKLFGGGLVDVILTTGNAIYQFVAKLGSVIYTLLKPIFSFVRTILGFLGNIILRIGEFFGVTVSASALAEDLQGRADAAKAKLDQLTQAQKDAAKAQGNNNPLDAAKGLIPELPIDVNLQPFDTAAARDWIRDAQANLDGININFDFEKPDFAAFDKTLDRFKDLDFDSIFNPQRKEGAPEFDQAAATQNTLDRIAKLQETLATSAAVSGAGGNTGTNLTTFNAALANLTFGNSAADRTAKATEETARNTAAIAAAPTPAYK